MNNTQQKRVVVKKLKINQQSQSKENFYLPSSNAEAPRFNAASLEIRMQRLTELKEEINTLRLLWNDMGVTPEYKYSFECMFVSLDFTFQKTYIDSEIASIKTFVEHLEVPC